MKILIPMNVFLRVKDKFAVDYIDIDQAVPTNPTLLYKNLFRHGIDTGKITLPQKYLSKQCKYNVRTLQPALSRLVELGYIRVEPNPGRCSTYVLLYSERVKEMLREYGCEVLEDGSWYPRDVQSSSAESRPVESGKSLSGSADSSPKEVIPPQDVQRGYENPAHPSYNVYKNLKNNTPPTPHSSRPAVVEAPLAPRGGEGFLAPSAKSSLLQQAFDRLWAVWPIKQARQGAIRIFRALARAGRLPVLDALLEAVEHLRTHDDRWQRGYVPHLANWLRDERWADEPVVRSASSGAQEASPTMRPPAQTSAQASAMSSAARMDSRQESIQPPLPELPPSLDADVHTLCALWPTASRSPVRAFFRAMLASGKTPDMGVVLGAARQHLAENLTPRPLFCWLREELRPRLGTAMAA